MFSWFPSRNSGVVYDITENVMTGVSPGRGLLISLGYLHPEKRTAKRIEERIHEVFHVKTDTKLRPIECRIIYLLCIFYNVIAL